MGNLSGPSTKSLIANYHPYQTTKVEPRVVHPFSTVLRYYLTVRGFHKFDICLLICTQIVLTNLFKIMQFCMLRTTLHRLLSLQFTILEIYAYIHICTTRGPTDKMNNKTRSIGKAKLTITPVWNSHCLSLFLNP